MMYTDDPVADAYRRDCEEYEWLQKRPICAECGEHIADEDLYDINGDLYCEECMKDLFKKQTENYIKEKDDYAW